MNYKCKTKKKKDSHLKLSSEQYKLVEDNIYLAYSRANIMMRAYENNKLLLDKDDFESYAFEGLCDAALRYDSSKGVKFSTFAVCYMDNIIKTNVHIENSTIKIPTYTKDREKYRKLRRMALSNSMVMQIEYFCQKTDGSSGSINLLERQGVQECGFSDIEHDILIVSMENALEDRDRFIFRELFTNDNTIKGLAKDAGMHPNTVGRRKKKITNKLAVEFAYIK